MDGPADKPYRAAETTVQVRQANRTATIGTLVAYACVAGLVGAMTLGLSGLAVMGTDPCFPDSPCVAAYERWVRALWIAVAVMAVVCAFGVARARSFRGKLVALLCLPVGTVIVWLLFLANSAFSDAGTGM
jgi:hypothetical protein